MLTKEQKSFLENTVGGTYTINSEGKVDVIGGVFIQKHSLQHIPVAFGTVDHFVCNFSDLKTLQNAPEKVNGDFMCLHNHLENLIGAPRYVRGFFNCDQNQLKSLEGCPKYIGGKFSVEYNPDLDLLANEKYIPKNKKPGILCLL